RLYRMVGANQVGAVFIATVSRLSRQLRDFEIFRIMAAAHNTLLYTDGKWLNPANANDTIMAQMTAMIAQYDSRQRVEIMSQARITKAKLGAVVSSLPVGWIKGRGGKYRFDPEAKEAIQMVITTFFQTRSAYRTVQSLIKAGNQVPSRRHAGRLVF